MKKILSLVLFSFFLAVTCSSLYGADQFSIERRRPQKSPDPNRYYVVPWFVHVDGIGTLLGGVAGIANILDSGTNAGVFTFQNGNFHLQAFAIDDLYLLGNYDNWASLTLSGGGTSIELKELDSYGVGTDSSGEPNKVKGSINARAAQLQLKLFVDRLKYSMESFYSRDSFRLADLNDFGVESEYAGNRYKLELDLTDDRYDSRFGLRAIWVLSKRDPDGNMFYDNESEDEFEIFSREISLFIPLYQSESQIHTLALNYYLSTSKNLNDELEFNRREGNTLGGPVRMRGYPNNRFVDSHTYYYAAEYRLTFLGDFGTKGDFILSNDTLEGLQVALFQEWGQVSEKVDETLFSDMKVNTGVGFRAIWDSSLVMRLDIGFSDEGQATTFLIMQPF